MAIVVFGAGAAVLMLATALSPSRGLHETFGWPLCGFKQTTRLPCATCGMTTAFTYAADGDLLSALRVQPMGALLAVLVAIVTLVSGYAAITGMSLQPLAGALARPRVLVGGGIGLLVAWVYTLTAACTGAWHP